MLKGLFPDWPAEEYWSEIKIASGESLSRVQFWHFLVANLQQRGLQVPSLFGELNDTTDSKGLIEKWKKELSAFTGFKIGIVWQGNPRQWNPYLRGTDKIRSLPLAQFEILAKEPGVRLISLLDPKPLWDNLADWVQIEQLQWDKRSRSTSARNRTRPQWHPPSRVSSMSASSC